jgi:hypothetical protein
MHHTAFLAFMNAKVLFLDFSKFLLFYSLAAHADPNKRLPELAAFP